MSKYIDQEDEIMIAFTNRTDVEQYVTRALGEFVDNHDVDAIIDELVERTDGWLYDGNRAGFDDEMFWQVVETHAR